MRVDEIEPRRRAPMAEQARLHMLEPQLLLEQRIGEEIDLADREVIGGTPIGVDRRDLLARELAFRDLALAAVARLPQGSFCRSARRLPLIRHHAPRKRFANRKGPALRRRSSILAYLAREYEGSMTLHFGTPVVRAGSFNNCAASW